MRHFKLLTVVPVLFAVAACGNDEVSSAAVAAAARSFQADLELAVSQPQPLSTVSPVELGYDEAQSEMEMATPAAPTSSVPAPVPARQTASRSTSAGSSGTYEARVPVARTEVVRNTKRDAAIGAGAGAVIGAVAGGRNDRVKGAVIGAVLGGAVGAVVGHTVDTDTRTVYE